MTFSTALMQSKGGIEKHLMIEIFNLLPDDAKLFSIDRSVTHSAYGILFIASDEFKSIATGTSLEQVPEITAHFRKDGINDVYVEKLDMTEAIDRSNSIHPYVKYGCKANALPPTVPGSSAPKAKLSCYTPRWKQYVGILDSYKYCDNCGKKDGEHL